MKKGKKPPSRSSAARLREGLRRVGQVAAALSQQQRLDDLLKMVLTSARDVMDCDAGSLYMVEREPGKAPSRKDFLADKRFFLRLAQNDSVTLPFCPAALEITKESVAGHAARTGKPLNIIDAGRPPKGAAWSADRTFDEAAGYRTVSMLLVPVKNHRDELLAVLQLVNRRRSRGKPLGAAFSPKAVLPFDADSVEIAQALAAQTAVALENFHLRESLQKLNRIGIALSQEHELDCLLEMILTNARELISCDAGSLYLLAKEEGRDVLYFKLAQNDSASLPFKETRLPLTRRSVVGFTALSGEPLNLDDVGAIPGSAPYRIDRSFDEAAGYKTVSMLSVPMKNRDGDLLGVLQLINRRRAPDRPLGKGFSASDVVAFDADAESQALSLAGQAAVAIENSNLYAEIKRLFDSFVSASVTAIEARDPTTSGHSSRVALYTTGLAKVVDRSDTGPYAGTRFSADHMRQIEYASLLHDFGKIGVREAVLVKAKKLEPRELALIEQRGALIELELKLQAAYGKLEAMRDGKARGEAFPEIEARLEAALGVLRGDLDQVRKANQPSVLDDCSFAGIQDLARRKLELAGPEGRTLLTEEEASRLGIRKGSLSEEERHEIETHVSQTYRYLKNIPWPRDLARVPEIAYAHHEKLNGGGYPRGIRNADIPLEARMMAICDVYDALTAWDRPYKKAVPARKALAILEEEVRGGALDGDLVRLFIDAGVFKEALPAGKTGRG